MEADKLTSVELKCKQLIKEAFNSELFAFSRKSIQIRTMELFDIIETLCVCNDTSLSLHEDTIQKSSTNVLSHAKMDCTTARSTSSYYKNSKDLYVA